ncbi:MAG: aspartate/glutamate racemase family protein [Bryobacterales bacterium]|nr:aspartate/glutamate racemase family protein [Bryobacterales bacterium]
MRRQVAFIHTSPAAIPMLADYYLDHAPELEITNLLDDGILRFFARQKESEAEERFVDLLCAARDTYNSELAMVTCSAVSRNMMRRLEDATGLPLVKIDEALALEAVTSARRLGVLVSFPPTQAVIRKLLEDAAADAGVEVELTFKLVPEAYEALLGGKNIHHDELLLEGLEELGREPVDAIVLAQVSMARLLRKLPPLPVPVLSSLRASLNTIRERLGAIAASTH